MQKHDVQTLFDAIAYRYDLLNHLLSGGMDLYWRRRAVEHLRSGSPPKRILDVATGTGDLAMASLRLGPREVIGVDIAENMLKVGREKIREAGLQDRITLLWGDAENLAYPAGAFDAAIVAFGVRNFENLERGLREMYRVLAPGGRIVVLEFSRPSRFPLKQMYFFYFLHVLPRIGRALSHHDEAYRYLPDTVLKFPEGQQFLETLRNAGFTAVTQERLTFGIATIYDGRK